MNDDELKKLWQEQPLRDPAPSPAQLNAAMQRKMTHFRRSLQTRDAVELLACASVVITFGYLLFNELGPISRLGYLIVIGSTIFIAWKLVHAHRTTPPAPLGATVLESLRAELLAVRTQSRLLGSVLWWYLLPPGIGLLVATWGMRINLHAKIPFTIFYITLYGLIYWLNQRARSKQLLPVEAQLESLIHSAETGAPLSETRVAKLRPVVLSMAAADQVKPVEFKVAFWQIAIFGIPGIVGIWFFLMLGLPVGNASWKTKAQSPKTFAPIYLVEETNRYSVVARKIIDLLNTGDYAAVQKLFNPEMNQALPPTQASDFFTGLATNFGMIEKVEGPTGHGYRGWTAFHLDCQGGELTMSLALDADDKIAGIYFQPAPTFYGNIKAVIHRIFSWRRLAWSVPFFLVGLLYSRIIQKVTERAAGISTLGIHLSRGQNLILWDEIKEVRPFKFLHIRNLWLIKESGEKTIMHWTPLERHPELMAAVETFAPPNHPIRQYLPLLKRR